jgi:hypothetical protein
MATSNPTLAEVPVVAPSETRVATGKGELDGGTSGEILVRRGVSRRFLDDQSTFIDLVSNPHRSLVTGSLPFLGSSPDGPYSVFHRDLYLKRSAVDSMVSLPTIFEGTPLEFFSLDLDSSEHVEGLSETLMDLCSRLWSKRH